MLLFDKIKSFGHIVIIALVCLSVVIMSFSETARANTPKAEVFGKPVVNESNYDKQQIDCLAQNAYYEAGNQSIKGKIAVTQVVMNRVGDKRFGNTPCKVVRQKRGRVCQFSWVCMRNRPIMYASTTYQDSKTVAYQVYHGICADITRGAQFYHANYIHPHWHLLGYVRIAQIGQHYFYVNKG